MNKSFVRGIWGNDIKDCKKLEYDINWSIDNDISRGLDFVCYVWGENNYKYLLNKGIKSVLASKDLNIQRFKHYYKPKLDIYKRAMEDFDEIVYLDWDCNLVKDLPIDFWDKVNKKSSIGGCIYRWGSPACFWRNVDSNWLINGGFLYMQDKKIPDELISIWNNFPNVKSWRFNDEKSLAFYIDKLSDGWKGLEYWKNNFETEYCFQEQSPAFPEKPDHIFEHKFHGVK